MRNTLVVAGLFFGLLVFPAMADQLSNDVAECLLKARAGLGADARPPDKEQIDAYVAQGAIYFNNPFVNQNPTFAFWKCLRLKGYIFPS